MATRTGLEYGLDTPFGAKIQRKASAAAPIAGVQNWHGLGSDRIAVLNAIQIPTADGIRVHVVSRFDEPLSATLGLETIRANLPITAGNPGQPSTRTTGQLWPVYG
jgi:hypothetical protein